MKKKKQNRKKIIWFFLLGLIAFFAVIFWWVERVAAPEGETNEPAKVESSATADSSVKSTPAAPAETTFTIAGDMMFDRSVYHAFKDKGSIHVFDKLDKSIFSKSDIRFANLEGPVSAKPIDDDYYKHTLVFNMPTDTIDAIKNLGLNGVSLANNHTLNAGASGFVTTKSLLSAAGFKYGGSQNSFDDSNIIQYDTAIPVSIICVDYLAFYDNSVIDAAIKKETSNGNFVIMFPHWGTEYSLIHTASQENTAKKWIDAGASLIIGSHPHVVEDVGIYKNVPIVYSLGNFVFDQMFSADTQQGLIVSGKITADKLSLTFHPTQEINIYPQLATTAIKNAMLSRILSSPNLAPFLTNGNTITVSR